MTLYDDVLEEILDVLLTLVGIDPCVVLVVEVISCVAVVVAGNVYWAMHLWDDVAESYFRDENELQELVKHSGDVLIHRGGPVDLCC